MTDFYQNAHFFATSTSTWATTNEHRNLFDLIRLMDSEKRTYSLWYVPCHWDNDYAIKNYVPQVQGALRVESVYFKDGRRAKTL